MTSSPMISPPVEPGLLQGAQEPRIRAVPDYVSSAGRDAIELCALAGLILDPWQQLALWDMLGERADGKWACYEFGLVVPRQCGKGTIFEARELIGLFLLNERLLVHSAHEQATSSEHFRRVLNLIEGVPEFDRRVLKAPKGKGAEAIELRGGQRIFFKTRTLDGGRGLTGDFVGLDEAMKLRLATVAALGPTMAARSITANPQIVYGGSAVDAEKDEHGVVLARVRERAMSGNGGRLGYHEYSCEGDDPGAVPNTVAADPQRWAQANPGLGIRISLEYVADERNLLDARSFAVERLGIGDWPDTSDEADRVITSEAWQACACTDETKRIEGVKTFAADVNPGRTWGAISVAGYRDDELLHVATVRHDRGNDWIIRKEPNGTYSGMAVDLNAEHEDCRWVMDEGGPAGRLIQLMKDAGLEVIETATRDYEQACSGFYDAVQQRRVRYPVPQPDLDEAIASARTTTLGDRAWKWSPKSSTSADITPLVAGTLAVWAAETHPAADPAPLIAWR